MKFIQPVRAKMDAMPIKPYIEEDTPNQES